MGTQASEAITRGLRYLAGAVSTTAHEFARATDRGLLDAVVNLGYVRRGNGRDNADRYALTDAGQRRLQATEV